MKNTKTLERYFKGAANHRRLDILYTIDRNGDMTLGQITKILSCNFKTISGHTRYLVQAGLLDKKYQGNKVIHSLSPYGKKFIDFAKTF